MELVVFTLTLGAYQALFPLTPALSPGERVKLCREFGEARVLTIYPAFGFH